MDNGNYNNKNSLLMNVMKREQNDAYKALGIVLGIYD